MARVICVCVYASVSMFVCVIPLFCLMTTVSSLSPCCLTRVLKSSSTVALMSMVRPTEQSSSLGSGTRWIYPNISQSTNQRCGLESRLLDLTWTRKFDDLSLNLKDSALTVTCDFSFGLERLDTFPTY